MNCYVGFCSFMLGIVYGALIKEVGCKRNKDKKKKRNQ